MDEKAALEKAIRIAGGQSGLERRLKQLGRPVRQQSIGAWVAAGELPDGKDWGLWIARAVDFEVTPHELDKSTYPNAWDGLPIARARPLFEEAIAA